MRHSLSNYSYTRTSGAALAGHVEHTLCLQGLSLSLLPPPPPPPRLQDGLEEADDDEQVEDHHHTHPHAMDLMSQLPLPSPLPSSVEGQCYNCDHGDGGTSTSTSAHSLTASVSKCVSSNDGEHQLTQMPLSCNGKASAPPAFALHLLLLEELMTSLHVCLHTFISSFMRAECRLCKKKCTREWPECQRCARKQLVCAYPEPVKMGRPRKQTQSCSDTSSHARNETTSAQMICVAERMFSTVTPSEEQITSIDQA